MFKVIMHWDGHEYSEGYHYYEYASKSFETLNRLSKERKANGQIDEYYVELIKED